MARREGRNAPPLSFFTPPTLTVRIIIDLAFSLPCWCVRLDRCCVELHYGNVLKMPSLAHGELGQNATPIIMKFDTMPTQSQARPQNNQPPLRRWSWRTCSWASNTFTRWSYSLWWQMVVLIHGAWFNFRRFLWNDHILISGALAKHCRRWTSQKEQRWLRTRYPTRVLYLWMV